MTKKIRIIQFGCGPIGCKIAEFALSKPGIEIVGAIDLVNVGRDLGEVAGLSKIERLFFILQEWAWLKVVT